MNGFELLDFGIAKILEEGAVVRPKLTQENSIVGTPEYMSPEALLASPDVDARTDQYALGVTLYECLTGTVPFDGQYAEVLRKLSTTEPRPLQELRTDVPDALALAIARSLSRDPAERFSSMSAFGEALDAAVSGAKRVSLLGLHPPKAALPGRDAPTVADVPKAKQELGAEHRRKFPRAPYVTLARILCESGLTVDGRVEEVSEGGLQFVGDRAVPVNESVTIRFALPATGRMAEVKAEARWNRSMRGTNATGFQFSDLLPDVREEIQKYVAIMRADP